MLCLSLPAQMVFLLCFVRFLLLPPPPQTNVQGCISIGVSLYSGGGEGGKEGEQQVCSVVLAPG